MANKGTRLGHLHYKMMSRCYREKDVMYKDYGAKGIKVCEEWHDRPTFIKWCINNGWQKGLKVNRYDGKKDYCPENCYLGNVSTKREDSCLQKQKKRAEYNRKKKEEANIKGLMNEDPLYDTFIAMHERCENKKHINYKNYGGKGIMVCEEWCRKGGFPNFKKWAIENGWAKGLTLDRMDNNKGYYPNNCRWATRLQQCYNKTNNILYSYGGMEMPLGMIAKLEDVKYGLLYTRVRRKGMSINEAISDIKKSGS